MINDDNNDKTNTYKTYVSSLLIFHRIISK